MDETWFLKPCIMKYSVDEEGWQGRVFPKPRGHQMGDEKGISPNRIHELMKLLTVVYTPGLALSGVFASLLVWTAV